MLPCDAAVLSDDSDNEAGMATGKEEEAPVLPDLSSDEDAEALKRERPS